MANASTQFGGFLTNVGTAQQANTAALGLPWNITHMLIGDADGDPSLTPDPTPDPAQTTLVRQVHRAQLNALYKSPADPSVLVAELVLPPETGGWWIRELGLEDDKGNFIAVAKPPPSYKPLLAQGSGRTQTIRMHVLFGNTANVSLKIDPSIVLATREYVDSRVAEEINKLDSKQSVRVATTANIALTGLQTIDGVALMAGDRVLVKHQVVAKDNGLYIAAAAVWRRAPDADSNVEVTSGLIVSVEQGATLADTRWQLVTDGTIVLGTTGLAFQNITQGFAPIVAPALVDPTANTPPQFDSSLKVPTTEFVQRALGNMAGYSAFAGSVNLTVASAGKYIIVNNPGTITLPDPTTLPLGTQFTIEAIGSGATVTCAGNPIVAFSGPNVGPAAASAYLLDSNVCQFVVVGAQYRVFGGSGKALLSTSGYQKLPSGLIIQWGLVSGTTGDLAASYPIAFPNKPLQVVVTMSDKTTGGFSGITPYVLDAKFGSKTTLLVSLWGSDFAGGSSARYIAVGH